MCVCFSRRVLLRSDRRFLPNRPGGQNNHRALGGHRGVGGGKFSYSMVGKRGERAAVWFLSVCLCLVVRSPTAYGANCTARERE